MKRIIVIVVAAMLTGSGIFAAVTNGPAKQETVNQNKNKKRKVSCSSCNGTGKAGSGVKGEGKYSCTRCKGTGWM